MDDRADMTPRKDYKKEILELIPLKQIFSFTDIFVFYKKITRQHAYRLGYDKCDDIKEAIYNNKRKGVTSMIAKWVNSDNPTLQIAAMRIIADDQERRSLNQQYIDHTTAGDKLTVIFETSNGSQGKEN
jgi:hypothetical protein